MTAKIKLSSEDKVVIRMPVGGGIEAVLTQKVRGLKMNKP